LPENGGILSIRVSDTRFPGIEALSMRGHAFLLALLLTGCAVAPTVHESSGTYFNDSLFGAPSEPVDAGNIFALTDDMRVFINREIGPSTHGVDRRRALFDALYSKEKLKLEYDSTITRNATQAFHARSGNCLSLVILTSAFAKQLGVPVQYQNVFSEQTVSRLKDTIYVSGHVNLTLLTEQTGSRLANGGLKPMTIDFLPPKDTAGQHIRVIQEKTIIAMFMNNRAAENFSEGKLDDAYYWARAAMTEDPTFLEAYNTLGVIYMRHGNLAEAENVLRHVVDLEPGDPSPMSNLVLVLDRQGKTAESAQWAEKLRQIQAHPPFYYFDIGQKAMQDKDYAKAKDMFNKEIRRQPYYHEFHAWLAAADYETGDIAGAKRELQLAIKYSTSDSERSVYVERLKTLDSPQGRLLRH
jgi:tetratricopeptide (TPR) repeat protein